MKKILLILLSISLFTSCDVEPLDRAVVSDATNDNENGSGNSSEDPIALSTYSFDVNTTAPLFGNIIINSDFAFNGSNRVSTSDIVTSFFGQTSTENVVFNRDDSNRITGYTSMSGGVLTNETIITYTGNNITQIVYNFIEDDEDDYTYNFTYSGNSITRTVVGSTITTKFTLNSLNQLVKKESFEGTASIKTEVLDYDGLGNCITSVITGEDATSSTFRFDGFESPLKPAFGDQFKLAFLNDDYEDSVGSNSAQFASPNNWIGITTPEGTVNFTVMYDTENRITSRNANYDLGDGATIQQSETFNFVN